MNKLWIGILATLGAGAAAGAFVLYTGALDVSADTPHSPLVYRLLELARERSIEKRSISIIAPLDLSSEDRQRRGSGNYAAMCASCHLSPGLANSEIRQGLYPQPPDLTQAAAEANDREAARRFWIIKHGIKASGMSAWSKGGMEDAAIWDLVAFLQKLPTLTPEQYRDMVESSEGHSHAGLEMHHAPGTAQAKTAAGQDHPDEGHAHASSGAHTH